MDSPFISGCRVCGAELVYSRGLCQKHYRRFKARFDELASESTESAHEFEEQCLRDGWVLAKTKGGRKKQDSDPFDLIAAKIRSGTDFDASRDRAAEEASEVEAATDAESEVSDKNQPKSAPTPTKRAPRKKKTG